MTSMQSAIPLSTTDPIFSIPDPNYSLTAHDEDTGELILAERYRLHLVHDTQSYVLELCRLGLEREAGYVASCCTRGMVLYRCPSGDYSQAVLHTCHDPGCRFCGRGRSRLITWARTHNIDRVTSEHLQSFELVFTAKEPKYRRQAMLHKFARSLGLEVSTLIHDCVDPASVTKVRIAIHGRPFTILRLRALWSQACPGGFINRCQQELGTKQLEWVFSGLEPMLLLDGAARAKTRASLKGSRLIRTTGQWFRPMTKDELAAFNLAHAAHEDGQLCPKCKLHVLEHVPLEKRITLSADEIESQYDYVRWGGGESPFHQRRVIANRPLAISFEQETPATTSPPN